MVPIKKSIDRIPGGMMIVPLFLGAIIRTVFPELFKATSFTNSFTGGLMTGILPLLAAFYVCLGATIDVKKTGYVVKKGVALWIGKVALAGIIGLLLRLGFPHQQNHLFLGLSALAIIAAFTDTNGGLYMALLGQLGREEDVAAYSIMSVESGPFFTMLILGVVGLASFPLAAFIFALLPLILGIILGNLDPNMRTFLASGKDVLIPLFALALGSSINLTAIVSAGASGILLGFAVVVISGIFLVVMDKVTGGTGLGGMAAASTAGNASAVPMVVAAVYVAYKPIAAIATVQVAAAVIVTAILVPILTAWYARRFGSGGRVPSASESVQSAG